MTRRIPTLLAATAVCAGAVALTPATAGGQTAPCAQPYSPVAFAEALPSTPTDDELPPVPGTDVAVRPAPAAPDTDGDGTADTLDGGQGTSATVTRGSGVVELTSAGASSVSVSGVADIDGDGRDELSVSVDGGADEGTFLVPGTVPDGSAAVVDAGIRLADAPGSAGLQPGSGDRLLVAHRAFGEPPWLDTHDATDVLALGPGGDAGTIGPEISRKGLLLAFVDLGRPLLGLVVGTSIDEDELGLTLVDVADEPGEDILLTSSPEPAYANGSGPFGPVEVVTGSEGTFVRLTQSSRSGTGAYLWSIDDPCTPYDGPEAVDTTTSTTPVPSAPAAQPVDAAASFTG